MWFVFLQCFLLVKRIRPWPDAVGLAVSKLYLWIQACGVLIEVYWSHFMPLSFPHKLDCPSDFSVLCSVIRLDVS